MIALLLGVFHFLRARGELGLAAAVDDGHLFRTEALGAARGVHRDVAAAHDAHLARGQHGGAGVLFIRLHQIDAGQKFVCGIDAFEAFARDVHKAREPRAAADEHRLEAVFLFELVNGEDAADDHVGIHLDAQRPEVVTQRSTVDLGRRNSGMP